MTTFSVLTHILEDDEDVKEEITRLLDDTGLTQYCHFYSDPRKFLSEVKNELIIAVIDHMLPGGLTGLDVVKAVKRKNKYSYIIILTGQDSKKVIIEYINAGASKYIDKNERNYLVRLVEELKIGFLEIKDRIEFINFKQSLQKEIIEGQKETDELMTKLK